MLLVLEGDFCMFEGVQTALQHLTSQRDRIDKAIASLTGLFSNGAAKVGSRRRRRARRPGRPQAKAARRRKTGKRAPRGLLKAKIHQALKGLKTPLAPVELRDKVIHLGYPAKNPKSLYTSVFVAAKADKAIQKTAKGFSLK
jgi:hypothetical protein